ncbi:MAG: hypothetical protein ACKO4U_03420 [Caldilinea sp.]
MSKTDTFEKGLDALLIAHRLTALGQFFISPIVLTYVLMEARCQSIDAAR